VTTTRAGLLAVSHNPSSQSVWSFGTRWSSPLFLFLLGRSLLLPSGGDGLLRTELSPSLVSSELKGQVWASMDSANGPWGQHPSSRHLRISIALAFPSFAYSHLFDLILVMPFLWAIPSVDYPLNPLFDRFSPFLFWLWLHVSAHPIWNTMALLTRCGS
jgi:hypothetical protein